MEAIGSMSAVAAGALAGAAGWLLSACVPARAALPASPSAALRSVCAKAGSAPLLRRIAQRDGAARALDKVARGRRSRDEAVGLIVLGVPAAALAAYAVSGSPAVAGAAPFAAAFLAALRARREDARRAEELEAAMPDVFRMLSTAIGSGCSLSQAVRYVGDNADGLPAAAFRRAAFSIDCGVPVADVLDELKDGLPAPGMDLVVSSLKISQRTGAPLKELLDEASGIVAARAELRRSLDVKTSQARLSARVVACMPIVMICFLALVSGDFQRGLATPVGMCSVAAALVLDAAAWAVIRRIMEVEL